MRSNKEIGPSIDDRHIQWIAIRIYVTDLEGTDDGKPPNAISIGLRSGGTSRVKVGAYVFNRQDANIVRQQCVRSAKNRIRIHRSLGFDTGHLAVRVDTSIGAAGTRNRDIMIEQFPESPLEFALHSPKLRLNLPAVKARAVVRKCQLEVPHSIGYSMWLGVRTMPGITATIITLNEEERIGEALASLACCDEIIVVDSGSTDRTREIASSRGARVITRPWEGYSRQKNFAAAQASHNWILSIDADERLSIELADEIVKWKKERRPEGPAHACSMARRAFYLGKWIHRSGWYPDRKVRLYDRRHCRWEGTIHEDLTTHGDVLELRGDLLHFPFIDWEHQKKKIDEYAALAAKDARARDVPGNVFKLVFGPPLVFIKSFFLRRGFLDGWRGVVIAYAGARYVFLRALRILRSWT